MSERWPPMIGVVGFDGGYKSAVALALPPEGLVAGEGEFAGGEPEGTGACCNADNSCTDGLTQFDCTSSGGIYQGDGTDCASVDCGGPPVTGACCIDGECSITTGDGCSGIYQGDGTDCDPNPCLSGACCISGQCSILTAADCATASGFYQGDGTTCDSIICALCNGCYCSISSPFFGCNGLDCDWWTRVEDDCNPLTPAVYSGRTTFDALYVMQVQTQTCCPPDSGMQTVTDIAFCNDTGFGPFCDSVEIVDGSVAGCGSVSVTTELFGLAPTPC